MFRKQCTYVLPISSCLRPGVTLGVNSAWAVYVRVAYVIVIQCKIMAYRINLSIFK
jgi:hypothetical protein